MKEPLLATVDIGSNSILLLIGRMVQGKLHIETQRKETIRLGGALDAHGHLQMPAIERGLECLRRFAGLMADVAPSHRKAVATQTLREAKNRTVFLEQAQHILRCPVELISGEREAALIYQGVAGLLPPQEETRLVIDIGGRSTELCIGQGAQLQAAHSCPIGSVAWAQRFFADGNLHASSFSQAQQAALQALAPFAQSLGVHSWQQAYGASGTAGAICKVLHQGGHPAAEIHRDALFHLREQLVQAGHSSRLPLQGLRDDIRPVIGGGVSIMCAVFDAFALSHMRIAQGALRHGAMMELAHTLQSTTAP